MDPLQAHAMMTAGAGNFAGYTNNQNPNKQSQSHAGNDPSQTLPALQPLQQESQAPLAQPPQSNATLASGASIQQLQQHLQLAQQNNGQGWLPNLLTMQTHSLNNQLGTTSTTTTTHNQQSNLPSIHHQQQQQQVKPQQSQPDIMQALAAASIVTGPNGQQMILNPSAISSLFNTNQNKGNSNNMLGSSGNNLNVTTQQSTQQQQNLPTAVTQQVTNAPSNFPQHANLVYDDVLDVMGAHLGIDSSLNNNSILTLQAQQQQQNHQHLGQTIEISRKRGPIEDIGQEAAKKPSIGTSTSNDINTNKHNLILQQQNPNPQVNHISPGSIINPDHLSENESKKQKKQKGSGNSNTSAPPKDMTPDERRRYERNLREQQRSHRISQQIKELRNVLTESKVPFKPNKYSILMSVADYIKQLQTQSTFLDGEMNKLLNTIKKSSELVNSGVTPNMTANEVVIGNDAELLYVKGLDYKSIFDQSSVAFAIASLDGRILHCNPKFERLIGYAFVELEKQNLFNLLDRSEVENAYKALGKFLRNPEEKGNDDTSSSLSSLNEDPSSSSYGSKFWSGKLLKANVSYYEPYDIMCALFHALTSSFFPKKYAVATNEHNSFKNFKWCSKIVELCIISNPDAARNVCCSYRRGR